MSRRSPGSTLFPYTTLFRSAAGSRVGHAGERSRAATEAPQPSGGDGLERLGAVGGVHGVLEQRVLGAAQRSEEHTSELQSLRHLVCRLLLEKKKIPNQTKTN